jgi:hypothetical protein
MDRRAYLAAFTVCLISDFFVPVRYGYANIFLLFPIALALPTRSKLGFYLICTGFGASLYPSSLSGLFFYAFTIAGMGMVLYAMRDLREEKI